MSSKITQTELGKEFGISSISMGKKLIELKLRDADTKLATQYAIDNKLGKIVTYTKAGQEIKMTVWNEKTIQYIKNKSSKDINFSGSNFSSAPQLCVLIIVSANFLRRISEYFL